MTFALVSLSATLAAVAITLPPILAVGFLFIAALGAAGSILSHRSSIP